MLVIFLVVYHYCENLSQKLFKVDDEKQDARRRYSR